MDLAVLDGREHVEGSPRCSHAEQALGMVKHVLSVAHENLALARTAVAHALLIGWTEFIPISGALDDEIAVSDEGRIHRTCSKSSVTDSDD